MEYFGKILGKIAEVDGIYTGNLGFEFNKLDNGDGTHKCSMEPDRAISYFPNTQKRWSRPSIT